jgi:hypothetical protein
MTKSTTLARTWSSEQLRRIAKADDLRISPLRDDGITHGTPTWSWSVVLDGALYVRAYNGQSSPWYQAAMRQKAGRIRVAGMTKDVAFVTVPDRLMPRSMRRIEKNIREADI